MAVIDSFMMVVLTEKDSFNRLCMPSPTASPIRKSLSENQIVRWPQFVYEDNHL